MRACSPGYARLTPVCSADGKIRLATLELSCLLLKQQVVTSTGCIIKDVHLACLEVRPPSSSTRAPGEGRRRSREAAASRPQPGPQHHCEEAGPQTPAAPCTHLLPRTCPSTEMGPRSPLTSEF